MFNMSEMWHSRTYLTWTSSKTNGERKRMSSHFSCSMPLQADDLVMYCVRSTSEVTWFDLRVAFSLACLTRFDFHRTETRGYVVGHFVFDAFRFAGVHFMFRSTTATWSRLHRSSNRQSVAARITADGINTAECTGGNDTTSWNVNGRHDQSRNELEKTMKFEWWWWCSENSCPFI